MPEGIRRRQAAEREVAFQSIGLRSLVKESISWRVFPLYLIHSIGNEPELSAYQFLTLEEKVSTGRGESAGSLVPCECVREWARANVGNPTNGAKCQRVIGVFTADPEDHDCREKQE
jgi:hypothetical protein